MKTKRLTSCDNSIEADNLMAQLRAEGIECTSYDESMNKAVVGGNIPGIAILVPEDRYEEGLKILNRIQQERQEFVPWCPDCGSEDIAVEEVSRKSTYSLWNALILLVLAVACYCLDSTAMAVCCAIFSLFDVVIYYDKKPKKSKEYTCRKCGKKFRK